MRLDVDDGGPAEGSYDFRFTLHDAVSGGSQVGSAVSRDDVAVSSGAGVDRFWDITVSDQIHEFIRKQLIKPSEGIQQPGS